MGKCIRRPRPRMRICRKESSNKKCLRASTKAGGGGLPEPGGPGGSGRGGQGPSRQAKGGRGLYAGPPRGGGVLREDIVRGGAPAASNEFVALVCELPITMDIVPRSKANVFEAGNSGIYKDFFPDPAGPADPAKRIRDVERRFYVDLAIKGADNVFRAKRKLTAIGNTSDGKPAPNREITWNVAHCTDLEFEVGGARSRQPQAVKTDPSGLAEITVVHRAAPPNSDMSLASRAIFTASAHGAQATIELAVTR